MIAVIQRVSVSSVKVNSITSGMTKKMIYV